jgi:hypothetical protein
VGILVGIPTCVSFQVLAKCAKSLSGLWDSNPRHSAWEAIPLRDFALFPFDICRFWRSECPPLVGKKGVPWDDGGDLGGDRVGADVEEQVG